MKNCITSLLLLVLPLLLTAQNWQWVKKFESNEFQSDFKLLDISTHSQNGYRVILTFKDSFYYDDQKIQANASGRSLAILTLGNQGNLTSTKTYSISPNQEPISCIWDSLGNVFIAGSFIDTCRFGNVVNYVQGFTNSANLFLCKINIQGGVDWITKIVADEDASLVSVAVNNTGNIFLMGNILFTDQSPRADFYSVSGDTSTILRMTGHNGQQDVFIAAYDTSGYLKWLKNSGVENINVGYNKALTLITNSYNEIITVSEYSGLYRIDSVLQDTKGATEIVISKFSESGKLNWYKKIEGTSNSTFNYGFTSLYADDSNIYLSSTFSGNLVIEGISLEDKGLLEGVFIKLNRKGVISWVKSLSGQGREIISNIDHANKETILIGGFESEASWDGKPLWNFGGFNSYIAGIDESGVLLKYENISKDGNNVLLLGNTIFPDISLTIWGVNLGNQLKFGSIYSVKNYNTEYFIANVTNLKNTVNVEPSKKINKTVLKVYPNPAHNSTIYIKISHANLDLPSLSIRIINSSGIEVDFDVIPIDNTTAKLVIKSRKPELLLLRVMSTGFHSSHIIFNR